jgi:catechol 2,3-dioxygenase-like lactoylglutathione lyase family enzyme
MIRGAMVEIPVGDVATTIRFYIETLGVKLVEDRGEACAILDVGQGSLLALVKHSHGAPRSCVGLEVANVERAVALLENRGIVFRSEGHGGRATSTFSDPEGNTLYLFES